LWKTASTPGFRAAYAVDLPQQALCKNRIFCGRAAPDENAQEAAGSLLWTSVATSLDLRPWGVDRVLEIRVLTQGFHDGVDRRGDFRILFSQGIDFSD
jgi:hypothetical protein